VQPASTSLHGICGYELPIARTAEAKIHGAYSPTFPALDNVGTMVAFRSKSKDTEQLLLHQFRPYIEEGEILNLPAYNFYMKIAAVEPQEPLSGETIVLPKDEASEGMCEKVVAASRARWAIAYEAKENATVQGTKKKNTKKAAGEDKPKDEESGDEPPAQNENEGLLGADAPI
jgi:hypothetical protein